MDVVLLILTLFGFGATVAAVYIFAISSRAAHSTRNSKQTGSDENSHGFVGRPDRRVGNRRKNSQSISFPIEINGVLISKDRRSSHDQRATIH